MRFIKPLLCAATFAVPAWAADEEESGAPEQREIKLQCTFASECFEAESCAATTFTGELVGRAGGINNVDMVVQAEFITEIGDTLLLGARSGKAISLIGGDFDARHLLTIAADGGARYTLHYADGPMAISYFGVCE